MESIFCQWVDSGAEWTCSQCGATVPKSVVPNVPFAACRVGAEKNDVPFRAMAMTPMVRPGIPRRSLSGPGTELKKMLAKFGLKATPGCQCNQRMMTMNHWGCDECERRLDEIVGWLREEAQNRGLPFIEAGARMAVRLAIRKARIVATEQQP
jgi:hypothetical protein